MTFIAAKRGYRLHVQVLVFYNRSHFSLLLPGLEVSIRTQYHLVPVINLDFCNELFSELFSHLRDNIYYTTPQTLP